MTVDISLDVHAKTTRLDIHEVARQLVEHLGATVVATLANVRDRKLPYKWAKANGPVPQLETEMRLRTAHQIWSLISPAESDYIARAWFIGVNPRLGNEQPIMVLRAGRHADAFAAARAFVAGTDQ